MPIEFREDATHEVRVLVDELDERGCDCDDCEPFRNAELVVLRHEAECQELAGPLLDALPSRYREHLQPSPRLLEIHASEARKAIGHALLHGLSGGEPPIHDSEAEAEAFVDQLFSLFGPAVRVLRSHRLVVPGIVQDAYLFLAPSRAGLLLLQGWD